MNPIKRLFFEAKFQEPLDDSVPGARHLTAIHHQKWHDDRIFSKCTHSVVDGAGIKKWPVEFALKTFGSNWRNAHEIYCFRRATVEYLDFNNEVYLGVKYLDRKPIFALEDLLEIDHNFQIEDQDFSEILSEFDIRTAPSMSLMELVSHFHQIVIENQNKINEINEKAKEEE